MKARDAALLLGLAAAAAGCRQDMHDQPKYIPLRPSSFFDDGRSERMPVAVFYRAEDAEEHVVLCETFFGVLVEGESSVLDS